MKSTFLAVLATAVSLSAWAADPPANAQATETTQPAPTEEQVVAGFRNELMARRADVMAKGLTLTAEQAAKFWPLFEQFQKEQDLVVQEQIKATDDYAKNYEHLTDENALATWLGEHPECDTAQFRALLRDARTELADARAASESGEPRAKGRFYRELFKIVKAALETGG